MFIRELEDVTIKEVNKTVTLECEISKENLTVDWYKGERKLRRDDKFDIKIEGKVHKLIIEKCDMDDIATYSATYKDLKTACKLDLAIAPKFESTEETRYMKVSIETTFY